MAKEIALNRKLWLDGFDLSGDLNAIALEYGARIVDVTTFAETTEIGLPGLKTVAFNLQGLFEGGADLVDDVLFARIGAQKNVLSIGQNGTEGAIVFSLESILAQYTPGAAVGEAFAFSVSGGAVGRLVRATLVKNGTETATGAGTAFQLGAVVAPARLYAALHVIAASGTTPTLDVTVESDDAAPFATPITRITFAQKTAIGAEWATPIVGPITDDFWRAAWTIGGASPSFTFVVVVGIQ